MFSQSKFYVHMKSKYHVDFIVRLARQNIEKLSELVISEMIELYENEKYERYDYVYDELCIRKKSIFESIHFARYLVKQLRKEVEKSQSYEDIATRIIRRAYNCIRDIYAQKKSMMQNKSKYADIDIILAVIETADEYEVASMYVTVSALRDKLDEKMYSQLRVFARKKFKSCRIPARYFLYVLKRIDEFENELADEEEKQEIENIELIKTDKIEKKNKKIYEIQASELDFKKRAKGEKLDKETKLKLYMYRRKYAEELSSLRLSRLTKDDALFFIINAERFVENNTLSLNNVLKIIRYADSNIEIKSPIGWLISRFSICRGRFYFLLSSRPKKDKPYTQQEQQNHEKPRRTHRKQTERRDDTYIREDLAYFAHKYSVPLSNITNYARKMNLRGDISIAVEQYLIVHLWKHYISTEEKRELIQHAREKIKKFVVPPKPEEIESYMKSIIRNEIRSRYLTLSIEDKIRLFSQKQHSNLQYYDTS